MGNLFQGCSVNSGQVVSEKHQLKKKLMKQFGITGKRLRALQHKARISGDDAEKAKYGITG